MTTPYPAPAVFPDIEDILIPWLPGQLAAVWGIAPPRACSETPENLQDVLPVVAVLRSSGADLQGIIDRPVVDVDCYAADRVAASLLAAQVHRVMLRYLPGEVTGGAVVGFVNTVKGPSWLSYQDLDLRRYNATYEIYLHPAPA